MYTSQITKITGTITTNSNNNNRNNSELRNKPYTRQLSDIIK